MTVEDTAKELWGGETRKAVDNFPVSGERVPVAVVRWLGRIKGAAARANADLGLLDADLANRIAAAGDEIAEGAHDDQFPIDVFQTGSGTSSNMNANEVISNLAGEGAHPNDHVNMGQSSNDVFPSAVHLAALDVATNRLLPALEQLEASLAAKADEFKDIVKSGRTHLMDAVPVTLGQEFGGYAAQIRLGGRRVRNALPQVAQIPLGGTATGTGLNTHPDFAAKVREKLTADTGLEINAPEDPFEAQANRDALVELSGALKVVAVSLTKIANDLALMGSGPRVGIGEIFLPELQKGSSIMPGKVNPVMPEVVLQVAAQVIGNDTAITIGGMQGQFELNVRIPLIARNLLQSLELLTNASTLLAEKCVDGIEANLAGCEASAEGTLAVATALNPFIGYDKAAEIVKAASAERRHPPRHRARARRRRGDARQGARPPQDRRRLEGRLMSDLERRPGSRPTRKQREQRAYRLVHRGRSGRPHRRRRPHPRGRRRHRVRDPGPRRDRRGALLRAAAARYGLRHSEAATHLTTGAAPNLARRCRGRHCASACRHERRDGVRAPGSLRSAGQPDRSRNHELRLHRGRVGQLARSWTSAIDAGINHSDSADVYGALQTPDMEKGNGLSEEIIAAGCSAAGAATTSSWPRRRTSRWGSTRTTAGCRRTASGAPARRACGGCRPITSTCTRCTTRPGHAVGGDLAGDGAARPRGQDHLRRQQSQLRRLGRRPRPVRRLARHFLGLSSEQSLNNLAVRTVELELIPALRSSRHRPARLQPAARRAARRRAGSRRRGRAASRRTATSSRRMKGCAGSWAPSRRPWRLPGCCEIPSSPQRSSGQGRATSCSQPSARCRWRWTPRSGATRPDLARTGRSPAGVGRRARPRASRYLSARAWRRRARPPAPAGSSRASSGSTSCGRRGSASRPARAPSGRAWRRGRSRWRGRSRRA